MSEAGRGATDWRGSQNLFFTILLIAPLMYLSGCGSGQTDVGQSTSNSVPVSLSISMPQESAAASTSGSRFWAKLQSWLPSVTNAWAVTYDLSELTVTVTDSDQQLLTTKTESISSLHNSGDSIPIDLEVPVGSDRIFAVSAFDRVSGKVRLQGESTPTMLTAGQAAVVVVILKTVTGTGTVTGTVTNAGTGVTLPGATVAVTGTSLSTTTNSDGIFTLNRILQGRQTLTVSASGFTSMTQTVTVIEGTSVSAGTIALTPSTPPCNSHLTSLTVNQGQLSPAFTPSTQTYTVKVGSGVSSLTVTAGAATAVSINGQSANSLQVPLHPAGQSTTITVVIQCSDGTTRTYTITVNREAFCSTNLTALTVSQGTLSPVFSPVTLNYKVTVASTVSSLTVTATKQDANAVVEIEGQTTSSLTLPLGETGTTKTITIIVRCPDGTTKTYMITVNRAEPGNPNLANLEVGIFSELFRCDDKSWVPLQPLFDPSKTTYTVGVHFSISTVCVRATKVDPVQTLAYKVNGVTTASVGTVTLNPAGKATTIAIIVTASDGVTTKTYTVTVNRPVASLNNFLSALTASIGELSPSPFNKNTLTYSITVQCDKGPTCPVTSITATLEDLTADLVINGFGARSGMPQDVPLKQPGSSFCSNEATTNIPVEVTAQDGNKRTYTVIVTLTFDRSC